MTGDEETMGMTKRPRKHLPASRLQDCLIFNTHPSTRDHFWFLSFSFQQSVGPKLESQSPCSPGLPEHPVWHLSFPLPQPNTPVLDSEQPVCLLWDKMKLLNVPSFVTWLPLPHLHLKEYLFIWAIVSCRDTWIPRGNYRVKESNDF